MNSFQKTTLNLNTSFTIVKSRSNIFEIGDININSYILDIISLGLKYVPSFNKIDLFYILYSFYISLNRLNNSSIYSFTNTSYITRNNDHKSFNDFLKKQFPLKTKLNSSLYFLDTFRKEFLSHILEFFKKDSNINLSINKLKNILISLKKKEITITTADKNIGIILIDNNLYNKLCLEHLTDTNTYKKVDFNPQFKIFLEAKTTLENLNNRGFISDSMFKAIYPKLFYKKLANFRILIKLHKPKKFGIRPLVNCSNTTLSIISKTIDYFLKPIMINHYTYIKDSQNLIQLTKDKVYDRKLKLYSADFESLYTNIPLEKSILIIMEMTAKYLVNTDIKPYAFQKLLKLVLLNNYFIFKKNNKSFSFFLQIKGTAMGTSCGPAVANLFLSYFELKYQVFLNNSLYFRFIDDITYTDSNNSLTDMFPEIFPDLKLNIITGDTVQFLDLNMSFNIDRTIDFDLYTKPTFTGSYLKTCSNHPNYIFRGIIISLVNRIRRICSSMNRYHYNSSILYSFFIKKRILI